MARLASHAAPVSRLRPVVNAAGTTVPGVLPTLQDVFWVALAVTIFFGLIVGTLLTIFAVPVLYTVFTAFVRHDDPGVTDADL